MFRDMYGIRTYNDKVFGEKWYIEEMKRVVREQTKLDEVLDDPLVDTIMEAHVCRCAQQLSASGRYHITNYPDNMERGNKRSRTNPKQYFAQFQNGWSQWIDASTLVSLGYMA